MSRILFLFFAIGAFQFCSAQHTWQNQISGTDSTLIDIDFLNSNQGIATGMGGTIVYTTDGGETWETANSGVTDRLNSICFFDTTAAWIVGWGGQVLKSTDAGATWTAQSLSPTAFLDDIFFLNDQLGWICGLDAGYGVVYRTTDGGANWVPLVANLYDSGYSIEFVDENKGFMAAPYAAQITFDGGYTWNDMTVPVSPQLNRLDMVDANTGWICGGYDLMLKTDNGGSSWTQQTVPAISAFYWDIVAIDASHVITAGHGGSILYTENAGINWTQQTGTFTNLLIGISAIDRYSMWACGELGKIYATTGTTDLTFLNYEGDVSVCKNDSALISVKVYNYGTMPVYDGTFIVLENSVPVLTYAWTGSVIPYTDTIIDIGYIPISESKTYTITFTGDDDITNNLLDQTISIINSDPYGITYTEEICPDQETTLSAYGGSFYWLNATSDSTAATQIVSTNHDADFVVEITQYGCMDTDTAHIVVLAENCDVNSFTPNNDGINDFLFIPNLPEGNNTLTVFNRWGDKITSLPNYDNTTVIWDGRDKHGDSLNEGVYFYVLDNDISGSVKEGWIQILR